MSPTKKLVSNHAPAFSLKTLPQQLPMFVKVFDRFTIIEAYIAIDDQLYCFRHTQSPTRPQTIGMQDGNVWLIQ